MSRLIGKRLVSLACTASRPLGAHDFGGRKKNPTWVMFQRRVLIGDFYPK